MAVYPMWSQVVGHDEFDNMIEAASGCAKEGRSQLGCARAQARFLIRVGSPHKPTEGCGNAVFGSSRLALIGSPLDRLSLGASAPLLAQSYPQQAHHSRRAGGSRRCQRRSWGDWSAQRLMTGVGPAGDCRKTAGGANSRHLAPPWSARLRPDGHMLMVGAETVFVINPTAARPASSPMMSTIFAPVTGLVRPQSGGCSRIPSLPASNIAELIALAKQKPGENHLWRPPAIGAARPRQCRRCWKAWPASSSRPVHYRGSTPGAQRCHCRPRHAHLGRVERLGCRPYSPPGKAKMLARRQRQSACRSCLRCRPPAENSARL